MHQTFVTTPCWTFGGRFSEYSKSMQLQPTPTTYSPNKEKVITKLARLATFSKQVRIPDFEYSKLPGPGHYQSKISAIKQSKISMHSKLSYPQKKTPGPGTYNPQLINKAKNIKYSIGKSKSSTIKSITPSPLDYEIKSEFQMSKHSIKIPISTRKDLSQTQKNVPGPGSYDNHKLLFKNRSASLKFERDSRFKPIPLKLGRKYVMIQPGNTNLLAILISQILKVLPLNQDLEIQFQKRNLRYQAQTNIQQNQVLEMLLQHIAYQLLKEILLISDIQIFGKLHITIPSKQIQKQHINLLVTKE